MKNLFLMFFSALTIFCTYSQDKPISLGIRGGMNLSNLDSEILDMDARVGYQFGIVGEYQLPNNFFLNGSLNLTSKGAKYKNEESGDINGDGYGFNDYFSIKSTWNATYLELPIMLGYKVGVTDNLAIKFMVGSYIAYGIGGKISVKGYANMEDLNGVYTKYDESSKTDTFSDETFKRFDAGLAGAVSLEYSKFTFTLGYEYGLTDISQGTNSFHNRNAFASIGYAFF